ncbi:MAG TPA: endopeptidase La [Acidobacteriota bacterium]|nr:endopeptidase La [Acidobacteriota bacterium]
MTVAQLKESHLKKENEGTQEESIQVPETLPVLPLRDVVTFPYMILPLVVTIEKAISAVDHALAQGRLILLVTQRNQETESPTPKDMYEIGTVGIVIRMLKMPDQKVRVLVQGVTRAKVQRWDERFSYIQAHISVLEEPQPKASNLQIEALIRNVNASLEKAAALGKNISQEIVVVASGLDDPGRLADLAASNLSLKIEDAQNILSILDPAKRLRRIHELLTREVELLTVQQQITSQAKGEMDKGQREYFLRQQLKAIQSELGEGNELAEEARRYAKKADDAKLPKEAREEFDRQLNRLERMHPDMAETATLRTYLDWMVGLPWNSRTADNQNLRKARRILNEDHYGLEKVKARILEHLAVRKLKQDSKGPILCFVGPPGVGKTSLGRSIARALGRKFVRLSLGGVHDEAEIRGHRRTYVGALPGRIVQGMHQAGSHNPVFMMDEVDKLGADFRGDPSSALLEVLDPEQNYSFRDNYLGVPFDLSNVLFITTANVLDTIQPAFRDRMEVINVSGYTEEEKVQIARRHLVPKQFAAHGLKTSDLVISDAVLRTIIREYTREAGLRNLEREIAAICRKVAMKFALGKRQRTVITADKLPGFLGPPRNMPEERLGQDQVGIATGLAWTPVGGEILFVEAQAMAGKGSLILTGQMGDVMKESAQAALSYARAHSLEYGIAEEFFTTHDFHIHIPEGAIPKDGPSAGITLASALVSACTGRPVNRSIAMTGEITLRGDILPVGGIKEKVLAALRGGFRTVMLPRPNKKDLEDVSRQLRRDIKVILVEKVTDVLKRALVVPGRS